MNLSKNQKLICLVRHGQTAINKKNIIQGRKNFPLSEEGILQATETGKYLKENDKNWDIIYSSPLARAYETAEIIASCIGFKGEIKKNDSFIEREFGVAEWMPIMESVYKKILDDSWPGLESTAEITKRTRLGLDEIVTSSSEQRILICSHAHAIKGLLHSINPDIKMNFKVSNCSMNYILYEDGEYKILDTNIVPNQPK